MMTDSEKRVLSDRAKMATLVGHPGWELFKQELSDKLSTGEFMKIDYTDPMSGAIKSQGLKQAILFFGTFITNIETHAKKRDQAETNP